MAPKYDVCKYDVVQYAGNVLVMGAITPCDGDWYGGLRADDAESFLTALTGVEVRSGPYLGALYPIWAPQLGRLSSRHDALSPVCNSCLPLCYINPCLDFLTVSMSNIMGPFRYSCM